MEIQYKALVGTGYHTPKEVAIEILYLVDSLMNGGYEPGKEE